MLKQKFPQSEQGFALVEVLVAILITTLFVAVSMQAMVIAAVFKSRAQEFTEATTWIQEDLENVKYSAASLQYTSLVDETIGDPTPLVPLLHESTDTVLYVASVDGFKVGDTLKVGTDSTSNTIDSINTINKTITLTNPLVGLGTIQPKGALVTATTRCNLTRTTGFADGLRDQVTGSNETGITNNIDIGIDVGGVKVKKSTRTNKLFTMTRTTTIPDTAPFNVLQVSYTVSPTSGGSPVAKFYTEVIPNAAFQCP